MLTGLRNRIKRNPRVYDALKSIRQRLRPPTGLGFRTLDELSRRRQGKVNFLQIGANDGLWNDPIREFVVRDPWSGVFVEPIARIHERLQQNYSYLRNRKLAFAHAAVVGTPCEHRDLYTFSEEFLRTRPFDERLRLLRKSSFDRGHVERLVSRTPGVEADVIEAVPVKCLTVDQVLSQYWDGSEIDLLVVDAEGADSEIIQSIDFQAIRPEVIQMESSSRPDFLPALRHLETAGYTMQEADYDVIAIQPDFAERLKN